MTNSERQLNNGIALGNLVIWVIIFTFGIITLISPPWLEELSNPGLNAEAITIKSAGDTYLKNNEPEKAIPLYKSALKILPDYQAAVANLAIAYQKTRNYQNAILSFKYLLNDNPTHPDVVYYNLGELEEKTGNTSEALHYFLLAADQAPYPQNALQKAGKITMDQKRWEKAILLFEKAIDNRMTIENAYLGMIKLEVQVQTDSTPFNHTIPVNYAEIYDPSSFEMMLNNDINLARTYNNLGFCQANIKEYDQAIQNFNVALKISPSLSDARNNIKAVKQMRN